MLATTAAFFKYGNLSCTNVFLHSRHVSRRPEVTMRPCHMGCGPDDGLSTRKVRKFEMREENFDLLVALVGVVAFFWIFSKRKDRGSPETVEVSKSIPEPNLLDSNELRN